MPGRAGGWVGRVQGRTGSMTGWQGGEMGGSQVSASKTAVRMSWVAPVSW